jgi:predicted nucleic acid-binding protein
VTSKSIGSVAADANVLLSAVIGKAARRVFDGAPELRVVTSEVTLAEVRQYLPMMAAKYGLSLAKLERDLKLLVRGEVYVRVTPTILQHGLPRRRRGWSWSSRVRPRRVANG